MGIKRNQQPYVSQKENNARLNIIESTKAPEQEKKEGKEGERGSEGGEEMQYEMQYLLSSINKLTCVHNDELGWLDNEDPNIELLLRFPMQ